MNLIIETVPYPETRIVASKYDDLFNSMIPGQCVKVPSDSVDKVAHAMRKWIIKTSKKEKLIVRTLSKMPDGHARVWLLSKPTPGLKMADVPSRKINNLAV